MNNIYLIYPQILLLFLLVTKKSQNPRRTGLTALFIAITGLVNFLSFKGLSLNHSGYLDLICSSIFLGSGLFLTLSNTSNGAKKVLIASATFSVMFFALMISGLNYLGILNLFGFIAIFSFLFFSKNLRESKDHLIFSLLGLITLLIDLSAIESLVVARLGEFSLSTLSLSFYFCIITKTEEASLSAKPEAKQTLAGANIAKTLKQEEAPILSSDEKTESQESQPDLIATQKTDDITRFIGILKNIFSNRQTLRLKELKTKLSEKSHSSSLSESLFFDLIETLFFKTLTHSEPREAALEIRLESTEKFLHIDFISPETNFSKMVDFFMDGGELENKDDTSSILDIVENHSINIDLKSENHFTMLIPIYRKEQLFADEEDIAKTDFLSRWNQKDFLALKDDADKKHKILVFDSDKKNIEHSINILDEAGYEAFIASKSENFMDLIHLSEPDLIIIDIETTQSLGRELLYRLRNESEYSNIPVILITSRDNVKERLTGLELGADEYLIKPIISEELLIRVRNILTRIELNLELNSFTETLSKQEKLAQIGSMIHDLAHELKNLNVSALSGFERTREKIISQLDRFELEDENWQLFKNSIFENRASSKIINKRRAYFKEYLNKFKDSQNNAMIELLQFVRSSNMDNEKLYPIWEKLVKKDDNYISDFVEIWVIAQKYLDGHKNSNRTIELTKSILNFARVGTAGLKNFFIFEVVESCIQLIDKKLILSAIEIKNNIDEDTKVFANSSDIHQIVLNLLVNARDALAEYNSSENKIISLDLKQENERVFINFTDNGPGIPKDIKTKIFDRNFSTKGKGGSGIGLFLSKNLANKNEGDLRLGNQEVGTQFILELRAENKNGENA